MLLLGKFKEGIAPGIRVVLVSSKNFNKIFCSSSSGGGGGGGGRSSSSSSSR